MGRIKMGDLESNDSAALSVIKISLLIAVSQSKLYREYYKNQRRTAFK